MVAPPQRQQGEGRVSPEPQVQQTSSAAEGNMPYVLATCCKQTCVCMSGFACLHAYVCLRCYAAALNFSVTNVL